MKYNFPPSLALVLQHEGGSALSLGRQALVILSGGSSVVLEDHSLAVVFHEHIVSPVARLLRGGRPATILRRIITVNVNPVERRSRWARAHVSKERGKVLRPFRTHRNPAPAVVRILRVGRAKASSLGVLPSTNFRRASIVSRVAVRDRSGCRGFISQASAAFRHAAADTLQLQRFLDSAITAKEPARATIGRVNALDGQQPTVALARYIQRGIHPNNYALVGRALQGKLP